MSDRWSTFDVTAFTEQELALTEQCLSHVEPEFTEQEVKEWWKK